MRSSLISSEFPCHHKIILLIIPFLLFLLMMITSSISHPLHPSSHAGRRGNSCHPISTIPPPHIPSQFQRLRPCPPFLPPPPPPPDDGDEIDPRYGVEKRLVPSGPNPLHN
ncbi:hypothetical protein CDL12_25020 [Handroanthus impetiginosus]|uniref:CLAVATA3/ESR (CLE)-related protein 9 n=1 Tax=Handroanthus impetiginosus TaxID=429701 RepID=A0A2G9GAZ5_9LAMI|nr:hypothetical protein CDL12_25020 [Handroanthus impetiginosus]